MLRFLISMVLVLGVRPGIAAGDEVATAAAESVMERMGGQEAWNSTRYLKWRFMGRRLHHWDRFTGDIRIESEDVLVLMNIHSKEGQAYRDGQLITDPEDRTKALERGHAWWVNDSYWLIMPYKLLDPGVHLRDGGQSTLEDGRAAHRLIMTFDPGVGLTPRNRYEVWVADESGLVEQWAYFADAEDAEPKLVSMWAGWKAFGDPPIRLATERGRDLDWEIEVSAELPRTLFTGP